MIRSVVHDVINPALALSLVLFAASTWYLSQLFHPLEIRLLDLALLASFATCFVALGVAHRRRRRRSGSRSGGWRWQGVRLLPYLILLPGVLAVLGSPRLQISNHGFSHSAYVYQILAGSSPPDNALLPGFPANTYWLYHALLAVISHLGRLAPPEASALLNLVVLVSALSWMAALLRELGVERGRWPIFGFFVLIALFGHNLLGIAHVLARWLSGRHESFFIDDDVKGMMTQTFAMVLAGDLRLGNLFSKFLNFNGFPVGVLFATVGLYAGVRIARGRTQLLDVWLLAASILGAVAYHGVSGGFLLAVLPVAGAATYLLWTLSVSDAFERALETHAFRISFEQVWVRVGWRRLLLGGLGVGLVALPLALYLTRAARALPEGARLVHREVVVAILGTDYPLLLFLVGAGLWGLRRADRGVLFLVLACLAGFGLAYAVELPTGNVYKFVYLASLPGTAAVAGWLASLGSASTPKARVAGRVLCAFWFVLVASNLLYVGVGYATSKRFRDGSFAFEGRHVVSTVDYLYFDAYRWIRNHVPPDAVVVTPLRYRDAHPFLLFSERLAYVTRGDEFTRGLSEYEERAAAVRQFYSPESSREVRNESLRRFREFSSIRPLLLLTRRDLLDGVSLERAGLALAYRDGDAEVFAYPPPLD